MKRIFLYKTLVIIFAFVFGVTFIGCGRSPEKERLKEVVIWHWMSDKEEAFLELASRYERETGVKIRFELYAPSDAYSQKVRAAAQAGNLPDIYGILGEVRDFASFINSGHVLDLTKYMDANEGKWRNSFFQKVLMMNEFLPANQFGVKPGIYGVPIDVVNIEFLYNKDLFKKAGLDPDRPPSTWQEFIDIGRKLKAANTPGLVSGWGEMWMIDCLASNFAFNIMGRDKVIATIKGEVSYTDPDWIRVFDLFRQMRDEGLLASGVVTMINKQAEQTFANGRAAFAFNGSWCVNVYNGMNPSLNYGAFLPPQVDSKYPVTIWGGAGSSFMVNPKSPRKEEAVKFLMWLTDNDQQIYLSEMTKNLPSNKNSIRNIPEILKEFARNMDNTIHPSLLGVAEIPQVIEAFDKGIQSIIIGEKTPEGVATEVQALKDRLGSRSK